MEYVKKSIDFLIKNIILIIPLYVAVVFPLFFTGMAMNALLAQLPQIIQSMTSGNVSDPMQMIQYVASTVQSAMGNSALGGFFGLVLAFIAYPIVTGLIKKGLDGEEIGFDKFVDALKENFVQYLLYVVGGIIVAIIATIGLGIAFGILGLILGLLGSVGGILMVIIALAALVFGIYFGVRLFSLWLPSMIIDKAGIFEGLKKGFEASNGSFWLLFLVPLITMIASGILSTILGFLGGIVIIGPIILGAVSTVAAFFLTIFSMMVYKEKASGSKTEPAAET